YYVVIAARALDGHDQVAQVVAGHRLTHHRDGTCESGVGMGHLRRWDEYIAIEVAEHELGAGLGTIHADDAEMLGTHLLDAGVNDAARLLQEVRRTRSRPVTGAADDHWNYLQEKGQG